MAPDRRMSARVEDELEFQQGVGVAPPGVHVIRDDECVAGQFLICAKPVDRPIDQGIEPEYA